MPSSYYKERMTLQRVTIARSPLTNELMIIRTRKDDPRIALDRRPCEREFMAALVEHMLEPGPSGTWKFPTGAVKEISFGDKRFEISVKPLPPQEKKDESDKSS